MAERGNNREQASSVGKESTATLLGWRGVGEKNPFQDFAHEVVAATLYVLQVSRFREDQSTRLIDFLVDYGVPKDIAVSCLDLGLHPGTRKLLFNHEFRAFDSAFTKERAESKSWTPGNLRVFMSEYGQEATLILFELVLSLYQLEPDERTRKLQLVRILSLGLNMGIDPWVEIAILRRFGISSSTNRLLLQDDTFIRIGRDGACDLILVDPRVELLHANLHQENTSWMIKSYEGSRPVWFGDSSIKKMQLKDRDVFQIGPYQITFREPSDVQSSAYLDVVDISRETILNMQGINRQIGPISLLENINLTIFSGELLALIGPSGAGKTTLLNAINGVAPADTGSVTLNGRDFHELLTNDRSLVGIVPQDDLVLPELTVEESLYYSGRLRLPPQSTDEQIWVEVDRVLKELDIEHIRDSRIGDALRRGISGGQRKRVNLGQELISQSTRILFLDEPTSGLDPRASQDIVRLVRGLADKGRIIFLVTHDLTDGIINQVDNLLVLVKGGRLAFFGHQKKGLDFFNVDSTDKIFNRFGSDQEKWAARFAEREDYNIRHCAIRLAQTGDDSFHENDESLQELQLSPAKRFSKLRQAWRQFTTLTQRYSKVKTRDRTGLAVLLLQPPFLALVMGVVFAFPRETPPGPTQSLIFILSLSCLWFGMSAAVRELISDQVIFRREKRVGVGVIPYVLSKIVVLGVLVGLQAVFLSGIMYWALDMSSYEFSLKLLLGVSCLTAWVGMSIGLFLSSLWRSSEAAVGSLPLVLIPQIVFSSVMLALKDMGWLAKAISWLTIQRYTFDAFLKCGGEIAVRTRRGDFDSQPVNGTLWRLGLKWTDSADDVGFTLLELGWILSGITLVLLVLSTIRIATRE